MDAAKGFCECIVNAIFYLEVFVILCSSILNRQSLLLLMVVL